MSSSHNQQHPKRFNFEDDHTSAVVHKELAETALRRQAEKERIMLCMREAAEVTTGVLGANSERGSLSTATSPIEESDEGRSTSVSGEGEATSQQTVTTPGSRSKVVDEEQQRKTLEDVGFMKTQMSLMETHFRELQLENNQLRVEMAVLRNLLVQQLFGCAGKEGTSSSIKMNGDGSCATCDEENGNDDGVNDKTLEALRWIQPQLNTHPPESASPTSASQSHLINRTKGGVCDKCLKSVGAENYAISCLFCGRDSYCSVECQLEHHQSHRAVCAAMQEVSKKYGPPHSH